MKKLIYMTMFLSLNALAEPSSNYTFDVKTKDNQFSVITILNNPAPIINNTNVNGDEELKCSFNSLAGTSVISSNTDIGINAMFVPYEDKDEIVKVIFTYEKTTRNNKDLKNITPSCIINEGEYSSNGFVKDLIFKDGEEKIINFKDEEIRVKMTKDL